MILCGIITDVEGNDDVPLIVVRDDRVSVRLEGAPLGRVLDTIARKYDVRVSLPTSLADRAIWSSFDELSMDKALTRLLAGVSYVVVQETDPSSGSKKTVHQRVYVLSTGTRRDSEAGFTYAVGSANQTHAWTNDHAVSASERLTALVKAYESSSPGVERGVASALADHNIEVREGAFELVAYTTPDTETEAERNLALIERVANTEADAALRIEAMYVLSDRAPVRAEPVILQALSDDNPNVRTEAEVLLEAIQMELAADR
jgi:hypothetical protein